MRIKANIYVEYDVDPKDYHLLEKYDQKQAIQVIEFHSLSKAITEVLPWPPLVVDDDGNIAPNNQILEVKLEE